MRTNAMIIDVFPAETLVVTEGAGPGDPISFADDLMLDDVYHLRAGAVTQELGLLGEHNNLHRADDVGNIVHLDSCLTLMGPDGSTHEVLILVEVADGLAAAIFFLPLGELSPDADYRLVGVERHAATRRFAEAACGSFARGTHITLSDGRMVPIETLKVGDLILTRDAGTQPIRWIGQTTMRANGIFAPVVIAKGALHNEDDLVIRPDHRIFVYQREDRIGIGRAEVLIKARHLINGTTVTRRSGGFIDYFQLIFDHHHIIYAEGISAESHLIDPRTRPALPEGATQTDHGHQPHLDYEVQDQLIAPAKAAALLRRASQG